MKLNGARMGYGLIVAAIFSAALFAFIKSAQRHDQIPLECYRSALRAFEQARADQTGKIKLFEGQEKVFRNLDLYPNSVDRGYGDREMIVSLAVAKNMISFIENCSKM